jgi:uncharacterized RDD family membrane protein YckC
LLLPLLIAGAKVGHALLGRWPSPPTTAYRLQFQTFIFACASPLFAYQWWLLVRTGQTLGKRWQKIRVERVDGARLTFVSAVLLRSLVFMAVYFASNATGVARIYATVLFWGDAFLVLTPARRCLHDYLAGTVVVDAR